MPGATQRVPSESLLAQEALGSAWFGRGEYSRAEAAFRRVLEAEGGSALTEAKLGACQIQKGDLPGGLARLRRALKREPACPELYDIASAAAMVAGNARLASDWAAGRLMVGEPTAFHFALAAALHDIAGDPATAHRLLQQGLARFPHDADLRRALRQRVQELPASCSRRGQPTAFVT